jgi:hypothetical protein
MSVHVMVDIETFGTVPGSVIRSIGACTFKLDAAHVALQDAVHQAICVQAALKLRGRT